MHHAGKLVTAQDEFQRRKFDSLALAVKREPRAMNRIQVQKLRRPFGNLRRHPRQFRVTPRRNGMRARLTNSVLPTVRCSRDIQTVGHVRPLQAGGTSVARRALGCSSSTRATKPFNRSARSSCSFHQPRPKITGSRSSEVPEVCSSSTRFFSSNDSSACPPERKVEREIFPHPALGQQRQPAETIKVNAPAIRTCQRLAIKRHLAPARQEFRQLFELARFANEFRSRKHGRNIHAFGGMQIQE